MDEFEKTILGIFGGKPSNGITPPQRGLYGEGVTRWRDTVDAAATEYGVDSDFVLGVMNQESSGREDALSPKGAMGPMQLMPATAQALEVDDPWDPEKNIRGGAKLLGMLVTKYGDKRKALAAYNWGEPGLDRAIEKYGDQWDQHLPDETRDYIEKIQNTTPLEVDFDSMIAGIYGIPMPEQQEPAAPAHVDLAETPAPAIVEPSPVAAAPMAPATTPEITKDSLKFSTAPADPRGGTGMNRDIMEPPEMVAERYQATGQSESALESFLQQLESAATYRKDPEALTAGRFQANPVASAIGTGVGMVAPALVGGQALIKSAQSIPQVTQLVAKYGKGGKAAFDALSRMSVAGGDYTARYHEDLTSKDEAVRNKAIAGLLATVAASGASVAPEMLKSGWWQPILQGITGGATNVAAQAVTGENPLSPEAAATTIFQTLLGGVFGLSMARAPKAGGIPRPTPQRPSDEVTPPKSPDGEPVVDEVLKETQRLPVSEGGFADEALVDRRKNPQKRKVIDEMTQEEAKNALRYDELTGMKSRRAWEDEPKQPEQVILDVDGLKWANDNLGYEAGDELLKAVGSALKESGIDAYRIGGDEIRVQASNPKDIDTKLKNAYNILSEKTIVATLPDGTVAKWKGPGFSYGKSTAESVSPEHISAAQQRATDALHQNKIEREQQGLRAGRGDEPPGVSRIAAERNEAAGGEQPARPIAEDTELPRPAEQQNPEHEFVSRLSDDQLSRLEDPTADISDIDFSTAPKGFREKVDADRAENAKALTAEENRQWKESVLAGKEHPFKNITRWEGLSDPEKVRLAEKISESDPESLYDAGLRPDPYTGLWDQNDIVTAIEDYRSRVYSERSIENAKRRKQAAIKRSQETPNLFSDETGTLPGFEDTRKPYEIEQARREQERKQKQRDNPLEGTMFDQNEMEARATQQEDMFTSGLSPEEKIRSMEKEPAATVMGGVKYDPTARGNLPKYAGNVNIDRIGSDYDAKRAINDIADEYRGSIEANRGPKATHDETAKLAEQVGLSKESLLSRKKGEVWDRAKTLAARDLHIKAVERLVQKKNELMKKRQEGTITEQDMVDFLLEEKRVAAIQAEISGLAAEAGRLLESFKILSEGKRAKETFENIRSKIEGSKSTEAILDGLSKIDDADISTISKFIRRANKATLPERINRYFIESILSALPTDEANIAGNAIFSGMRTFLERPATAITEKVVAPLQGRKPEIHLLETKHEAAGLINSIVPAWKALTRTLLTGEQKYIPKPTEDIKSPSKSKLAALLPTRRLAAEDEFFKTITFGAKIRAIAYRTAKNEGLTGKAMDDRIKEITHNPELFPEQYAEAWNEAKYRTFTDDPGEITKAINKMRRSLPLKLGYYIVPFLNTPIKILKAALDRLPITGEISLGIKASKGLKGKEVSEEIGKLIPSHLLAIPIVMLARSGLITGAGPSKKEEKNVWNKTHQPYSVKIGDSYYSYSRFEPMSSIVGMISDFSTLDMTEENQDQAQEIATRIANSIQQNIYNKTFFSQLDALVSAAQEPGKYGERFIANFAGSAVPNIVAKVGESFDPYVREKGGVKEIIQGKMPGAMNTLFPKRDIWGEPIERDKKGIASSISPVSVRKISADKADTELNRLKIKVGNPSRNVLGVKLSDQQYDDYSRISGQNAYKEISRYINSSSYDEISDETKKYRINKLFNNAREKASYELGRKYDLFDIEEKIRSSNKSANELFNELKKSGVEVNRSTFWKKYNTYHKKKMSLLKTGGSKER